MIQCVIVATVCLASMPHVASLKQKAVTTDDAAQKQYKCNWIDTGMHRTSQLPRLCQSKPNGMSFS